MATVKQKLAFKKVLKGSTISGAMRDVGYADTTASTTGKLTSSKGWNELAEKHISEKALAKVHSEGLAATKVISAHVTSEEADEGTDDFIEIPDYAVRHKYLVTGYEVRGMLRDDIGRRNVNILVITGETAQRYGIKTDSEPGASSVGPA